LIKIFDHLCVSVAIMSLENAETFLELQTKTGWGRMLGSFSRWCAPQPGWRVLDIGSGPGLLVALFAKAGAQAFGIDHDLEMFQPNPLHPDVAAGDVLRLPFAKHTFDLITASNVIYLQADPLAALRAIMPYVKPGGQVALLNPSEHMTIAEANALADEHGLEGLARDTLVNFGGLAEAHVRWSEEDLQEMFAVTGLELVDSNLRMGKGLVRYGKGVKK
jgi:SAM-dependent methyltransferase